MRYLPFLLFIVLTACRSTPAPVSGRYNLDLERPGKDDMPWGWTTLGAADVATDPLAFSGERSLRISGVGGEVPFGVALLAIPARFRGSSITLTGYLRTEDVADGAAGLLLRLDGGGKSLSFDNMLLREIDGTRDWQEYSVTLDYPADTDVIYVGGILTGTGTAWIDGLRVTIDGEDVQTKAEQPPVTYAADNDHGFAGGSDVTFPPTSAERVAHLELLGRVWGFLKYHHPTIARGERQWDYALFRFLPGYLAARTQVQRESQLEAWVRQLGEVPACDRCPPPETDVARTADRDWIDDRIASPTLRTLLHAVYANRATGTQYYIAPAAGAGNPDFRHELAYAAPAYPDAGFRLLALYRYWNMVRYYFPYVGETDRDWEEVLAAYLPRFLAAEDELAYETAVLELITEVDDTHAQLGAGSDRIEEARGDRYAAVHLRFAEGQAVVSDVYNVGITPATDLAVGDVITHVDGRPVAEIVAERRDRYPASNEAARLRDLAGDLLRDTSRSLLVGVRTATGEATRRIPLFYAGALDRYTLVPPRRKPAHEWLEGDVGYVSLQNLRPADVPVIRDSFRHARGIIFDLRNYPSLSVNSTLAAFLRAEATPFVRSTKASMTSPGTFTWTEPVEVSGSVDTYSGPVVVLVSEVTQSAGEFEAMALRAGGRATVIGRRTAGADGNVSRITVPGGLETFISGVGIYYPDRSPTQRVGIVPDIEVPLTVAAIRAGRDEVLERALTFLRQAQ
ncbi:S41 family peptidase [Lewinella sp. IMCC34183]|uniref:S41 family peptidase n=1 Tax=Lewinella sp. IMCC34183 TaxID=2248762 RepID=UPI000E24E856|nr:S41 family peptidase [Lewinella sp. IMCC34183]